MKNLITTYCNQYKGDFLINDWLRSLKLSTNLTNIDILVIDFGLTASQIEALKKQGVIIYSRTPVGRMSNYQYKCLADFLEHHTYDQILYSDCGDVIFQSDISHLFEIGKDKFKAVVEPNFNFFLHKWTLGLKDFKKEKIKEIERVLSDKNTVNGGFVIGPSVKFSQIWQQYLELCHDMKVHGTDQLVLNYIMYRDGFEQLHKKYNYITFLNEEDYRVNEDGLYENDHGVIPVVHNAGRYDFARAVSNFGFKKGEIRPKIYAQLFILYYRSLNQISRFF